MNIYKFSLSCALRSGQLSACASQTGWLAVRREIVPDRIQSLGSGLVALGPDKIAARQPVGACDCMRAYVHSCVHACVLAGVRANVNYIMQ